MRGGTDARGQVGPLVSLDDAREVRYMDVLLQIDLERIEAHTPDASEHTRVS
jgi:hypothetical protein